MRRQKSKKGRETAEDVGIQITALSSQILTLECGNTTKMLTASRDYVRNRIEIKQNFSFLFRSGPLKTRPKSYTKGLNG